MPLAGYRRHGRSPHAARHERLPASRRRHPADARGARRRAARPTASRCSVPTPRGPRRSTRPPRTACCASRRRSCGRRPMWEIGSRRPSGRPGPRWCCSGPRIRSPCWARGWREPGCPTSRPRTASSTGSRSPRVPTPRCGTRPRGRARVPVMCSEFIARTVRTAVPEPRAGLGAVSGRRRRGLPPDLPTEDLRRRLGLGDRPVVVCVSRLVARKGQDVLIRGMERIRAPGARRHARDRRRRPRTRSGCARSRRPPPTGPSSSPGRCPKRTSLATTRWGTSSRCPAGRGWAAWRSRGGATCSSRRRHARSRWSSATRAALARRSSPARPACSSTAPTWTRSPTRSPACWPTPIAPARWARPGGGEWCATTRGRRSPGVSSHWLQQAAG